MPAKAGIQNYLITLDSRLRGKDAKERFKTFYENIKIEKLKKKFENFLHRHVSHTVAGNPQLSQKQILSIAKANFRDSELLYG